MDLKDQSITDLKKRRRQLVAKLSSSEGAVMRGSLIKRYFKCGKPGCKCTKGSGHGPKYYLSVSFPGRRPEQLYVPQSYQNLVEQHLANYQNLKDIIEEISNINREILRRRKEL
jgi:hypothetical protein